MAQAGKRAPKPLVIVSAVGLLVFGVLALNNAIRQRQTVNRPPAGAEQLWATGYGDLLTTEVQTGSRQQVVVTTVPLNAGDEIIPEFVELRSAQSVLASFPEFRIPGVDENDPNARLVEGFYERVDQVIGQYAMLDMPAGTPILQTDPTTGVGMIQAKNPFAVADDERRQDRITIALPEEPTLFQLLVPNDRIDIYLIAAESSVARVMTNVRIVAINNIAAKNSGILSAKDEARLNLQAQAADIRRQRLMAQHGGQTPPDQPAEATPPEDAPPEGEMPESEAAAAGAETGGVDEEEIGTEYYKLGRKFDGRTMTLQVTRQEAMILALSHNTPGLRLDFALHRRRH